MGGCFAIVPVKGFARAKSRLSPPLEPDARGTLARAMAEHVLGVLERSPGVGGIVVATDSDEVARLAEARGAIAVRDREGARLGAIVDDAIAAAGARGARAALVVMSDLPRLADGDVARLLEALATSDVVVAPDRRGEGTNALGVARVGALATSFGYADSAARHLGRAREAGLMAVVCESAGLGLDVDTPEDLEDSSLGLLALGWPSVG
jgi:2-phospho-L-lactate guanylyltransferase